MKYVEIKIFSVCVDVIRVYKSDDYDKKFEVLSTIKNKKLNVNNILIEKYNISLENLNIEQNYWSRTAMGIYKIGQDNVRLIKWICYYDRSYYENIKHFF